VNHLGELVTSSCLAEHNEREARAESAFNLLTNRLACLLLLLAFIGPTPVARSQGRATRPNVLFIVADDLRNSLAAYGDTAVRSPNFDRLARRSVLFDRAYVQYPVCNPSRASILTGLLPESTRVLDNQVFFRRTLPDIVTLPQLLKQQGYFTASLGKIFHRGGTMEQVNDSWADSVSWTHIRFYQGAPRGQRGEGRNLTGSALLWARWLAADGTDEDQPDGQIAAEAVRLIEEKRNTPFFIGIGFHKPHDPFIAPKKYFDLYPLDKIALHKDPPNRSPEERLAIPNQFHEFESFTDQERREFKRAYLAGVSFMDAQLGKVLDALDRTGLWNNTIVIFVGDHGYHLGERGWWNKATLFELSTRAPLVVYSPRAKGNGRVARSIVEFVDLYPTLMQLTGLTAPHRLAGTSLVPLLDDPSLSVKNAAYTVVTRGNILGRSIRTDRWRYTEWDGGNEGIELYDHESDPGEYHNLARDVQHAAIVTQMKAVLMRRGDRLHDEKRFLD
jgi:iduronate 2-sulfatase